MWWFLKTSVNFKLHDYDINKTSLKIALNIKIVFSQRKWFSFLLLLMFLSWQWIALFAVVLIFKFRFDHVCQSTSGQNFFDKKLIRQETIRPKITSSLGSEKQGWDSPSCTHRNKERLYSSEEFFYPTVRLRPWAVTSFCMQFENRLENKKVDSLYHCICPPFHQYSLK